jgi:hypothetical protein
MGNIADFKAALITKINAATGLTSVAWGGEEKAFTDTRPAVYVQWQGGITRENVEIGAISYPLETVFFVYVTTEDSSTDGDVQAALLLEQIRGALNGVVISGLGVANPFPGELPGGKTEAVLAVHAGIYLYAQAWSIEQYVD